MQKNIIVKLQIEGIHRWKECPLSEVKYLRDFHRHTFFIECKKEINHLNRDIEFIQFKHKIQDYFQRNYYIDKYKCCVFGGMSCEMICQNLIDVFDLNYCVVFEDNELGSEIINN
jgi:hypothetical protein